MSPSPFPAPRSIDCAECALRRTAACGDCVVTFLLGAPPSFAVVPRKASHVRLVAPWERSGSAGDDAAVARVVAMSSEEEAVLALLQDSGLAPSCRYVPAAG